MQFWIRSSPKSLCAEEVSLMAIEVLDALIAELIRGGTQVVEHKFLDWVADELTPGLESAVTHAMQHERFTESLRLGDPRIALVAWVTHWACPRIRKNFGKYAISCPCTRETPIVFRKVMG